jgi:integrase
MARGQNRLSDKQVRATGKPGRCGDGGGLYLQVGPSGSKAWIFMWKVGTKRTAMGLGPYPEISLAQAREKAAECRRLVAAGRDPLAERRDTAAQPTFAETVGAFLDDQRLSAWRNAKHRAQWRMTLGPAYCDRILEKRVADIGTADILAVLKPIWASKSETASRLRSRIEKVLAFAETKGWRPEGKNPAQWRNGLDTVLPPAGKLKARGHHQAMAYTAVPFFVERLRDLPGTSAKALEFIILTCTRCGEAVGARWEEFDLDNAVWTIPGNRMKAGRPHRVPLVERAVELLRLFREHHGGPYVFPSPTTAGKPISASSLEMLLRRLKAKPITIHGFRSAFRDWAGDETDFPRELAEAALAHAVGDSVERAYRRSDALERRRRLMNAWGDYIDGTSDKKVVPLVGWR